MSQASDGLACLVMVRGALGNRAVLSRRRVSFTREPGVGEGDGRSYHRPLGQPLSVDRHEIAVPRLVPQDEHMPALYPTLWIGRLLKNCCAPVMNDRAADVSNGELLDKGAAARHRDPDVARRYPQARVDRPVTYANARVLSAEQ